MGHIEDTAVYDGNVGLAAHNRGTSPSYFARINELEIGDEIIYQNKYGEKKYKVNQKRTFRNRLEHVTGNKRK